MTLRDLMSPRVAMRGAVIVVGAVLAYGALTSAVVNAAHHAGPRIALRLDAQDPIALTELAARLIGREETLEPDVQRRVADLSRRSIREQAINGPAVQMLGLVATQRGDAPAVARLFTVADKLSRRDLGTQFYMIENAVTRNDIPAAFRHYDAALRVSPGSYPILFPVMTTALEDPRLWNAFVPYLQSRPPWLGAFLTHAVRETARPDAFARLIVQAGGLPDEPEYVGRQGELLRRLVDQGRIGWAANYYPTLPNATPSALTSMALTPATTQARYMPIEWELSGSEGVTLGFSKGERGVEIEGMIDPAIDGVIARKLTFVAPGRYRFAAREILPDSGTMPNVRWQLECVRPSGRATLWASDFSTVGGEHRTIGSFTVSPSCPAVLASLLIRVPRGSQPVDVRVPSVALAKVG
ncbi:MAG: hypothetical protein V4537_16355 [Pseudomonadota bacterium]